MIYSNEKDLLNKLLSETQTASKSTLSDIRNQYLVKRLNIRVANQAPVGTYYDPCLDKIAVTADHHALMQLSSNFDHDPPAFLAAGPRAELFKDPGTVRVAILTGGGVAPGLNRVIYSIVRRHYEVYGLDDTPGQGIVYGIPDAFVGLTGNSVRAIRKLTPDNTREWIDEGGTILGTLRGTPKENIPELWYETLQSLGIEILYIIGGNGSLTAAQELFKVVEAHPERPPIIIAGIPKTMDNDILWTDTTFGFSTAAREAASIITALRDDAASCRRICLIQLFGRDSGFVAAHAALASGCADAVLVPEEFRTEECSNIFNREAFIAHMHRIIAHRRTQNEDYAIVVAAEGAGPEVDRKKNLLFLSDVLAEVVKDEPDRDNRVFINEPRHLIRAIPPNFTDHIFCERLANLAVDNALAGYTGFFISQWLNQFAMIPLHLVAGGTKRIDISGLYWEQVTNMTGQPSFHLSVK